MSVAVVIPWRPGTPERNRHKQHVTAHLHTLLPDAIHIDVDSRHTPFSRAGSRNEGVRLAADAGADVVVLCDADTLVEPEPLHAAIAAASDGVLHLPYTWYRGLSQDGTKAHLAGKPAADCPVDWEHEWATGGVLVLTPEAWNRAGGMDEMFRGWGMEDTAYRTAADALLGPTIKHHGTITHLWHPLESGLGSPQHVANGERMQRYIDATGNPDAIRAILAERGALYAQGGWLPPAMHTATNDTGEPLPVQAPQ